MFVLRVCCVSVCLAPSRRRVAAPRKCHEPSLAPPCRRRPGRPTWEALRRPLRLGEGFR